MIIENRESDPRCRCPFFRCVTIRLITISKDRNRKRAGSERGARYPSQHAQLGCAIGPRVHFDTVQPGTDPLQRPRNRFATTPKRPGLRADGAASLDPIDGDLMLDIATWSLPPAAASAQYILQVSTLRRRATNAVEINRVARAGL